MKNTVRNIVGVASAIVAGILSFMPVITGERDIAIPAHHFDHAGLMMFGAIAGLSLYRTRGGDFESPRWIWPAILGPLVAMLLMSPSFYAIVDQSPFLHSLNHLLFAVVAGLTAYAGQRYVRGVGWAAALMLELMAVAAAFGYGVAPPIAAAATATQAAPNGTQSPADSVHGKQIFAQDCASCHGAAGAGGMGPSLKNEHIRKDQEAAAAWIKKPAPPMPTLYPSVLNDKDVRDVASFIESLK
jgi:mono/diheme cytochrome c family protein